MNAEKTGKEMRWREKEDMLGCKNKILEGKQGSG